MKVTTRTPPVRIAAADMVALAALPPEAAGLLLRWGLRRYDTGHGVAIGEARREAGGVRRFEAVLQVAHDQLDADALAAGFVVVTAFARSADALAKVSAAKVRSAARIVDKVAAIAAGPGAARPARTTMPEITDDDAAARIPSPGPMPAAIDGDAAQPASIAPDGEAWERVVLLLVGRGAKRNEAEDAAARWRTRYRHQDVAQALADIEGRRVQRPTAYLDTMLANMLNDRRKAMPTEVRLANAGPALPRPVRRRISVGPRAGWVFEGWTAKGHPRAGARQEDRLQVFRNEAGTLSYRKADVEGGQTIPTFDEEPGIYEQD